MALNAEAIGRGAVRRRLVEELLDVMTDWHPAERARAFRTWMRGSLSLVHLHVLTVLEADGPLSMGRLADALDVSVASATGIVDRMEQRGLVERRPHPGDRRVLDVHATAVGAAVFRDLMTERRARLAERLDGLSDRELRSLLVGIRALHRQRAEGVAAEGPSAADAPGGRARRRRSPLGLGRLHGASAR